MVESGEREHSLVFSILEIQPFRRPATIQAMSLDSDRVSLPNQPLPYAAAQGWPGEDRAPLHVICMSFAGSLGPRVCQAAGPKLRGLELSWDGGPDLTQSFSLSSGNCM